MTKEFFDSFIDDLEKEKISQFYRDDVMREAVKKVIMAGLEQAGVPRPGKPLDSLYNPALIMVSKADQTGASDEQIGQSVRALWAGINQVEAAFDNMKYAIATTPQRPSKPNQAR
jgi:hypothetical protein